MPRFVVLRHELHAASPRASHFDLMLEQAGTLRTWAFDRLPSAGDTAEAEQLADHRTAFLDYEGPVSGGRGFVQRVAAGEYEVLVETDDQLRVRLIGDTVNGVLTIARLPRELHRWCVSLSEG